MNNALFLGRGTLLFLAISTVLLPQNNPPFGAPREMEICLSACDNLIWATDHYEQKHPGVDAIDVTYKVVRWGAAGIELLGKPANDATGMVAIRLIGKIGDDGPGIAGGSVTTTITINGTEQKFGNPASFRLTWKKEAPPAAQIPQAPAKQRSTAIRPGSPKPLPVLYIQDMQRGLLIQNMYPAVLTAVSISEISGYDETRVNEDYLAEGVAGLAPSGQRNTHLNGDAVFGHPNFRPAVVAAIFSDGTAYGEEDQIDGFMEGRNREQVALRDMGKDLCLYHREGQGMKEVLDKYGPIAGETQAYQWLQREYRNMRHFRNAGTDEFTQQLVKAISDRRNAILAVQVRNREGKLYISDLPETMSCTAVRQ